MGWSGMRKQKEYEPVHTILVLITPFIGIPMFISHNAQRLNACSCN